MKKITGVILSIATPGLFIAQSPAEAYKINIQRADSLYFQKNYLASAQMYSKAFELLGWKAYLEDRYNAACSWAMAGRPDSAFFNLERLVQKSAFNNLSRVKADSDLIPLHATERWDSLLLAIEKNRDLAFPNLNKPVMERLDSIFVVDQQDRLRIDELALKFGWESQEMKTLWKTINHNDSLNLIEVSAILDQYGWLGTDVVGLQGNSTLFLVVQHSNLKTQQKYLPMLREAVKTGKAYPPDLALLEDRVALQTGKKQLYGSQIGRDQSTNTYFVIDLDDPDHVDERRAKVGLGPLADYVAHWNIIWDSELYIKAQKK